MRHAWCHPFNMIKSIPNKP